MAETAIDYLSENDHATFCSNEIKWINKIKKLADANPDKVDILYYPEDNQGYILAHVPKSWLKVSPPRQVNYTEEQRAAMAERLAAAREKKN
ncbi:MAG: hypothetical protein ACI4XN_04275 [Candidatus Kurthia intestinigallinarum]